MKQTTGRTESGCNRIALFLPSLEGGGAERMILTLAGGFADRGLTVDLVVARVEERYLSRIPDAVRLVELGGKGVLASLPDLVRYLRAQAPAVLLSAMDHANLVALWARWLARAPTRVYVSVHAIISLETRNSPRWADRLIPFLIRRFYPWADGVIAISRGVAEDFAATVAPRNIPVRIIYNPVVTPQISEKAREPLDHPWFTPGEPPVVLGVGRLHKSKDFATLIRAFAQARRMRPARLIILGGGEEMPNLDRMVDRLDLRDAVSLPGFVDNPYVYMARAALLVLSSEWEAFGNVLVEAMALGTPVVATDCHGPKEILKDGALGRLVPRGDAEAMAEAIGDALATVRPNPSRKHLAAYTATHGIEQYLAYLGLRAGTT